MVFEDTNRNGQRDGAPNGYHIFRFKGNQWSQRYKAAFRDDAYQMRISSPKGKLSRSELDSVRVLVNVFNANPGWQVTCQVDKRPPTTMKQTRMKDPYIVALHEQYPETYKSWIQPQPTDHIWSAPLPGAFFDFVCAITVFPNEHGSCLFTSSKAVLWFPTLPR